MSEPAVPSLPLEGEREKQLRFEKLSETFSYFVIGGGIVLSFLPYEFQIERAQLYVSTAFISVLVVAWFRLLPRRYSGLNKNFAYSVMAIFFVTVAVHFTRGVESVTLFLYYLVVLGVAASMRLRHIIIVSSLAAYFIGLESILGISDSELGLRSLSVGALRIWGLLLTAAFGRLVFQQETEAKAKHEQAKIEQVQALDSVKNEFVFIVSNKLREPIAALQQYLKASSSFGDKIEASLKDLLQKTKENSDRLEALVEDLSDLSKIESGKLRLDLKKIDVGQVIGATMSDFTLAAHEKNIKLVYDPAAEPIVTIADSGRVHEIIANLVDNAIKYSFPGKEIHVSSVKKDKTALIKITDQGFGVPEEAKKHLFEKFYRVDRPDRAQPKGTGLGLFITKQLVERQGGKVWFESEIEKGTTFIFTLPLANER